MNWPALLPLLAVLTPLFTGLLVFAIREHNYRLRNSLSFVGGMVNLALIITLLIGVYNHQAFEIRWSLLPDIDFVLHADPLSLLFVSLSSILWLITTIYAIGYLGHSRHCGRFFGFFSFCVGATMGIALAGNLITFLIFYELLTLTTYPLVVHRGTPAALRAGKIYLAYTMIGGAVLLAGIVWLKALAGPLDFTTTGILSAIPGLSRTQLVIIFALLIAGLGVKAALVPLHGWLPIAMVAPAPVSALLHAVAVVKAGAFGIVRVVYDVYGIEFARDLGVTAGLAIIASITIVYGSLRALRQDDLKKRLAFSTVSQVSYIALGTAIAGPMATIGGIVHLVHQGIMKITLFFCAGNYAETLGIHKISHLSGIGRVMPWTTAAFTIAALGMIGMPPVAGFVSKWYLAIGALEAEMFWVIGVLAVSSLLNAAYFLPILYRAWFQPPTEVLTRELSVKPGEAHWMLLLPALVTASLALLAGLLAQWFASPLSWAKLIAAEEYRVVFTQISQTLSLEVPLLLLVLAAPLMLIFGVIFKASRNLCQRLLALAAIPAIIAALVPHTSTLQLPWLFFGSMLQLDEVTRVFLLLAALLWMIASWYSNYYLNDNAEKLRFTICWLLAMCGNFGLIMAQDLFGFISFFTLMSFAAYGLVVHSGSEAARLAGRRYIQWVIIGEVMLFTGLTGLAFQSGGMDFSTIRGAPLSHWIIGLLIAGFGVKTALLTLHFWLPLAHPVAPVPASAVLSGIMVKAGLLGWLQVLPIGNEVIATVNWGKLLMLLGMLGAGYGVVAGLLQKNPKALLAYSTISQMGILAAGVGALLYTPAITPVLLPALLLYAFNHGLAKGALFMSVGLAPLLQKPGWRSGLIWLAVIAPALCLAGLPATGGALAKTALKYSVAEMTLFANLLPVTAAGTSLLMLRFFMLLNQYQASYTDHTASRLFLPYLVLLLFTLVVPFTLPQAALFHDQLWMIKTLWTASWPAMLAVILYFVGRPGIIALSRLLFKQGFFVNTLGKTKRSFQP